MDDDYYYINKTYESKISQQILLKLEELLKWLILNFSVENKFP
ncbi:MAG: hypothetical protein K0R80_2282 [Clostridia bacterium]|jgi:hypothetical protein|nr:hypothetical protein [Clostridia bacterium]